LPRLSATECASTKRFIELLQQVSQNKGRLPRFDPSMSGIKR